MHHDEIVTHGGILLRADLRQLARKLRQPHTHYIQQNLWFLGPCCSALMLPVSVIQRLGVNPWTAAASLSGHVVPNLSAAKT